MQQVQTGLLERPVRVWLLIGVVMVFMQVVIGGVTRLTDSGLSITEWAVIQGTIPPLNQAEWEEAFELYKVKAKKQYETLHADMSLSEFKVIFFWEYFHRLWARLMGFVFIIPFFFFLYKKWIPSWLLRRLGVVIFLAALAASFGWIMVKSGLDAENRTWVSAYKLIIHLSIATTLLGYLFYTWVKGSRTTLGTKEWQPLRKMSWMVMGVLFIQIVLGGLMAGMRAGLVHPYFPFFVEGDRLLAALQSSSALDASAIVDYEVSASVKAWVQIFHRATAYLLTAVVIYFFFQLRRSGVPKALQMGNWIMLGMIGVQFLLGILTVMNSFGRIPITYGVLHQAGALVLLCVLLYQNYRLQITGKIA